VNHNAPDPSWIMEEEVCERCGCLIMTGEPRETRYGATWCGGCCNAEDDVGEVGYTYLVTQ
jgi:hypothetical protein